MRTSSRDSLRFWFNSKLPTMEGKTKKKKKRDELSDASYSREDHHSAREGTMSQGSADRVDAGVG